MLPCTILVGMNHYIYCNIYKAANKIITEVIIKMSQYKVRKLNKPINCVVEVPGSKSITNRALLMQHYLTESAGLTECCLVMIQDIFLRVLYRLDI